MSVSPLLEPRPKRIELPRIGLFRDRFGQVTVKRMPNPAMTSTNELLDRLASPLAVVEFWYDEKGEWQREGHYYQDLAQRYPCRFLFEGQEWHIVGGTINSATRGEVLATVNRTGFTALIEGWTTLDGLNRVKAFSRLMQPSIQGAPFELRLLVLDDPLHDGDGVLGESGLAKLRSAFSRPHTTVFKCISHWLKVVFRGFHPRWDDLPLQRRDHDLFHQGQPIDGILYRENIKLGKDRFPSGSIITLTEHDLRLHTTEEYCTFHRAGIGRQLLQYLPASLAADLLATSDIPLLASHWAKAVTGDADSLRYILGLTQDDNTDEHELRSQLLRHLEAGCSDVSIPYLRQRVLPVLAGIFRNRVRKGRVSGAYLFAAPSTRLGRYEVVVPARMLSHEEREQLRSSHLRFLASRYPLTGPASINAVNVVAMHSGAIVYVNPHTWRDSFQGDFDGDCISIFKVDPKDWQNSGPWIPPTSEKPKLITTPQALEQAAFSKRDVALGESALAEFIHRQWEERGCLDHKQLNELGTRVICAAVDRAKHGAVSWGITPDDFAKDYLPEKESRRPQSKLGGKQVKDCPTPEAEIRTRLALLKAGDFRADRSGWELLLGFVRGWTSDVQLLPEGDHDQLYRRILELHASLPPSDGEVFAIVKFARRQWASAIQTWKHSGDDAVLKDFTERFQSWIATQEPLLVRRVLLELGRQLLRPRRKGNASLFLSQVPTSLLREIYVPCEVVA